jgi:2-polyprenyl-6-hydroxyphenyl methylase/3-demethylubiquinone-9 3-methyltransferase
MTGQDKNIDPSEILKFSAMADYWWNPSGRLKSLHDINPLRLGYMESRVPLTGKKVLDIGCGGGLLSEAMAESGAVVTGIDMSEASLGVATRHMQGSGLEIDYRLSTAETFENRHPDMFDVVVCMELLEHVPNPKSVVAACGRLVKPGGDIFFATLNRNLKSYIFAILGAEYLLGIIERGTHCYGRFVRPAELTLWGKTTGLELLDLTGLHYNLLTRRYSLGGNIHVNYLAHFRRIVPPKMSQEEKLT